MRTIEEFLAVFDKNFERTYGEWRLMPPCPDERRYIWVYEYEK